MPKMDYFATLLSDLRAREALTREALDRERAAIAARMEAEPPPRTCAVCGRGLDPDLEPGEVCASERCRRVDAAAADEQRECHDQPAMERAKGE